MKRRLYGMMGFAAVLLVACGSQPAADISVLRQVTGAGETNTYLFWDTATKKAALGEVMYFDYRNLPEPDIYLEDNRTLSLGNQTIRIFISPGHSSGSACLSVGKALFSGDVLFSRQVGRTDLPTGDPEAIVTSVRRLYDQLADDTTVYPGHGEFTDIGSEKRHNEEVSAKAVNLKN